MCNHDQLMQKSPYLAAINRTLQKWLLAMSILATFSAATANNNMRQWKLIAGDEYRAELLTYDEKKKIVMIRLEDGSELKFHHDALSIVDQAWLLEWVESGEELEDNLKKLGGTLNRHTSTGKYPTEYSVYLPPIEPSAAGQKPPLLILFHPNGNGHREITRYAEAAKALGMNIVSCEYFRNYPRNISDEGAAKINAELLERFKEMLPQIEATVPHDPQRMFMGGCSGGAWRSYHYSAQVQRPWAGIFSNCGWMGGEAWYDLPYPKMRVAMVNGDKDPASRGPHTALDTARLQQAGCKVSLHSFEGYHQVPPPSVQIKAFRWLLSNE
jgi:predicted esterase